MEPNQILSGFRLVEERPVPETDSLGRLFIHEKSGARLLQLENRDPNKVFGIGFRTPSEGSTGVATSSSTACSTARANTAPRSLSWISCAQACPPSSTP